MTWIWLIDNVRVELPLFGTLMSENTLAAGGKCCNFILERVAF